LCITGNLQLRYTPLTLTVSTSTVLGYLTKNLKPGKPHKLIRHELNDNGRNRRSEVTLGEKWILFDNKQRSAQLLERDEATEHFPNPKSH
uniref:HTH_48 domain-containing protein n=1 Tax=Angiostrongylus costaricensis TaxID=334426 RepID=A0A0R3PPU2_ANGCS